MIVKSHPKPSPAKKPVAATKKPTGTLSISMSSLYQETILRWIGGTFTMMYISPIIRYLANRDIFTNTAIGVKARGEIGMLPNPSKGCRPGFGRRFSV